VIQSPKSDVYVAMLGISLGAIIIACILMTLIFSRYEFKTKVGLTAPSRIATLA
jgi:hypothetical protein